MSPVTLAEPSFSRLGCWIVNRRPGQSDCEWATAEACGGLRDDRRAFNSPRGHETPGRHPAAFGDGKAVPAAVCRLGDLNNKPEDGQLNTQPEHEPQGDRRK